MGKINVSFSESKWEKLDVSSSESKWGKITHDVVKVNGKIRCV